MKNFLFFALCGAAIVISFLPIALRYWVPKPELSFGFIPENEIQTVKWGEDHHGYYPETNIAVVTDRGDTTVANVGDYFSGVYMVMYKDSHPLSKGKKVFVKMTKINGEMEITEASLKPFEK